MPMSFLDFASMGSPLLSQSTAWPRSVVPSSDFLSPSSSLSMKASGCAESFLPMPGSSRTGLSSFVSDFFHVELLLPFRCLTCVNTSLLMFGGVCMDFVPFLPGPFTMGFFLTLRAFARFKSVLATLEMANAGLSLPLRRYARTAASLTILGNACIRAFTLLSDYVLVDLFISSRACVHPSSTATLSSAVRSESSFPLLDFASVDVLILPKRYAHSSLASPFTGNTRMGLPTILPDSYHGGSTSLMRGCTHLESSPALPGIAWFEMSLLTVDLATQGVLLLTRSLYRADLSLVVSGSTCISSLAPTFGAANLGSSSALQNLCQSGLCLVVISTAEADATLLLRSYAHLSSMTPALGSANLGSVLLPKLSS